MVIKSFGTFLWSYVNKEVDICGEIVFFRREKGEKGLKDLFKAGDKISVTSGVDHWPQTDFTVESVYSQSMMKLAPHVFDYPKICTTSEFFIGHRLLSIRCVLPTPHSAIDGWTFVTTSRAPFFRGYPRKSLRYPTLEYV